MCTEHYLTAPPATRISYPLFSKSETSAFNSSVKIDLNSGVSSFIITGFSLLFGNAILRKCFSRSSGLKAANCLFEMLKCYINVFRTLTTLTDLRIAKYVYQFGNNAFN